MSRFSVLPDDDLTDWKEPKSKGKKKKTVQNSENKKKSLGNDDTKELQSLAFGTKKANNKKNKKKSNNKGEQNGQQFEEWKTKDQEYVDESFASELKAAIMASKVEFAEEKEKRKSNVEEVVKSKSKTLSLDAFNSLDPAQIDNFQQLRISSKGHIEERYHQKLPIVGSELDSKEDFFDQVEEDAKKALQREQMLHSFRNHQTDSALLAQFRTTLEDKDKEISQLMADKASVEQNLANVKKRYKQFRELLDKCENRDKLEVLVENKKLQTVRDELTENVSNLTEENEKLKTKLAEKEKEVLKLSQHGKRRNSHASESK